MKGNKRLTLRVPDGIYQELLREKTKTGNCINVILRNILREHLYGGK